MKKLLLLGSVFALFTVAASAQKTPEARPEKTPVETQSLKSGERAGAHRNKAGVKKTEHKFKHDKRHFEKRKSHKMKRHDRRTKSRFHHRNRKRA